MAETNGYGKMDIHIQKNEVGLCMVVHACNTVDWGIWRRRIPNLKVASAVYQNPKPLSESLSLSKI